jgi:hypothetical protein
LRHKVKIYVPKRERLDRHVSRREMKPRRIKRAHKVKEKRRKKRRKEGMKDKMHES